MHRRSLSLLAAAAAIGLTASLASAADLPRKAPAYVPPAPPPFTWTGFYLGLHAGWGWNSSDASILIAGPPGFVSSPFEASRTSDGVVGGFQAGYNWQFAPSWVLGIEGDVSGTGIHKSAVTSFADPIFLTTSSALVERDVKWLASIRGRLGWAADRWLLYITGGGAWAGLETTFGIVNSGGFSPFGPVTADKTRSGWVVGGGVEYAFTPNWLARIEYLHYDLGDFTFNTASIVLPGFSTSTTLESNVDVVRVGVNYKF